MTRIRRASIDGGWYDLVIFGLKLDRRRADGRSIRMRLPMMRGGGRRRVASSNYAAIDAPTIYLRHASITQTHQRAMKLRAASSERAFAAHARLMPEIASAFM